MSTTDERRQIELAIAALEAQRASLGDAVVEAGTKPLRARLAELDSVPPADQRKQVTVLFADVSGFTALSETMDAEEVRDIVNLLWDKLDAAIEAEGGFIDKHIGDAVMALFGVPRSREDDAERAVRSALAMQRALGDLAEDLPRTVGRDVRLAMRIGLNTGLVIVGEVGSTAEYTALGDTVNLASRLETLAPVGGVLISATTETLVHGLFELEAREPARVKGKAEPVATFLVVGAADRAFRDPRRRLAGSRTRFRGRDAELAQLRGAVAAARAGGFAARLLVGEAGLGKSRLLAELDDALATAQAPPAILRARADTARGADAFGLVRDALLPHWGIDDADDHATALRKVGEAVSALGAPAMVDALAELTAVDPPALAPSGEAQQARREQLLDALRRYLVALGAERGAVVMLEDLHWADEPTLETVAYLVREAPRGVALLGTARPELLRAHPEIAERVETLRLAPLAPDLAASLATELIGDDTRAAEAAALAEGNPFFLEELARVASTGSAALPATLAGVLQARLESMPPAAVEACQAGSVVGRIFWDDALAHLEHGGVTNPELSPDWEAGLRDAVVAEIVTPMRSSFAGVRQFDFHHALLHEAAYESVLLRQRRVWHRATAEWLAALSPDRADERSAQIARHFALGTEPALAVPWHARAGERAFASYANQEAVEHYSAALDLLPASDDAEGRRRFELLLGRERALDRLGVRAAQAEDITVLEELAAGLDDAARARALLRRADLRWSTGDVDAARATASKAIELAASAGSDHLRGEALRQRGRAERDAGDLAAAATTFAEAADCFEDDPASHQRANLLVQIGVVHSEEGDLDAALESLAAGRAAAHEAGDTWDEAWALDNIAIVHALRGDMGEALAAGAESLVLAEATGSLFRQTQNRINLAIFLNRVGMYADASARAAEALEQAVRIDDALGAVLARFALGGALVGLGRVGPAVELLTAASEGATALGADDLVTATLTVGAEARLAAGDAAAGADLARRAAGTATAKGDAAGAAAALALVARALLARSNGVGQAVDEACAASEAAVAQLAAAGDSWDADAVWLARYLALAAAGAPGAADAKARAKAALDLKLTRISDRSLRAYLENHVAVAAEIAALD